MAGDDLVLGNLGVRGTASFGTSTQSFTGLFAVRFSTYAPAAIAASSGNIERVPSTAFTFSTNDIILGVTLPSTWGTRAVALGGTFPTSSGGCGFAWTDANSGSGDTPSTGVYIVSVLRTT